jgi:hypothetical protein
MQIGINIAACQAIAPGLSSVDDWAAWAASGQKAAEAPPSFDLLPVNLRRRMSLASKLAVQVALSLSSGHKVDYAIFVSRHGELQRTHQLINEVLSGTEASPTAFSQSVHNTAAGLFTIAAQNALPVTSLAAGEDSFCQGIMEACPRLLMEPGATVLLVCFDETVPDVYSAFVDEESFSYAAGLILQRGDNWRIETAAESIAEDKERLPQALVFLKHYFNRDRHFVIHGPRHDWSWTWVK